MEDENPFCTLGDYSGPSHEGYRNPIELLDGNNVVPLRSDTIRTSKLRNDILMLQQNQEGEEFENNEVVLSKLNTIETKEVVDMKKEVEDITNDEPVRSVEEKIIRDGIKGLVERPRSQPVGYYLKHEINKKLIEGLIALDSHLHIFISYLDQNPTYIHLKRIDHIIFLCAFEVADFVLNLKETSCRDRNLTLPL
nr:hypothetical protein [Tanacetum cinerariifolium]